MADILDSAIIIIIPVTQQGTSKFRHISQKLNIALTHLHKTQIHTKNTQTSQFLSAVHACAPFQMKNEMRDCCHIRRFDGVKIIPFAAAQHFYFDSQFYFCESCVTVKLLQRESSGTHLFSV